jgi:hypothetical protein
MAVKTKIRLRAYKNGINVDFSKYCQSARMPGMFKIADMNADHPDFLSRFVSAIEWSRGGRKWPEDTSWF